MKTLPARQYAVSALVASVLLAACANGSDDNEEETGDDGETTASELDPAVRDAARDPDQARSDFEAGEANLSSGAYEGEEVLVNSDAGCVYDSDEIVVADPDDPFNYNVTGIEGVADEFDLSQVRQEDLADPLEMAERLSNAGYFASPLYLASLSGAHMLFPGTLPTPDDPDTFTPPVASTAEAADVVIVDTATTGRAQENITWPWYYGHGDFVHGLVTSELKPGATIELVGPTETNTPQAPNDANTELLLETTWMDLLNGTELNQAISEGPTVLNLSFGMQPCTLGNKVFLPVATTLGFLERMSTESNANIVAVVAAGNDPEAVASFPASFAAYTSFYSPGQNTNTMDADVQFALESIEDRVIAVGAEAAPGHVDYSTDRAWVSIVEQGCHTSTHPGGNILYPGETNPVDLTDLVYWCGTSFAAPKVTAKVALALKGDQTPTTVKDSLLKP